MYYKTWQTGSNKYHAKKTIYNKSKYASQKEAGKAWELDQLLKAKQIKSWEKQVKIPLYGRNGTRVTNYFVDFAVTHHDGCVEYIEIKSPVTATDLWKLKWRLTEDEFREEIKNGLVRLTVEY